MPKVKITKAPTGSQADYGLVRKSNVPQTGDSDRKVKNTMTALKGEDRAKANIEVEGGETVLGDVNRDGYVELFEFKGKRHSNGGMDVDIPEGSFIFSDTKKLKIKDKEMLKQYFGLSSKRGGYTPAEISKKFQINEFIDTLKNPESDEMAKRSANEMIKNNMQKLGLLAFVQESIKGFPDGVPDIAQMALQELGVDPNQMLQEAAPQEQGQMPPQQEMMNQEQMPMAMYGKQVKYPDGGGLPTPNQSKESFDRYYHHLYNRLNKVYGQDFLASKPPGVDQGAYDLISNLLVWQDDRVIPNDPKMGQMVAAIKNSTMLPDDEIKTILSYNISQPLGMGDKFSLWRNLSGDTIDRFEDFKGYVKGKRGEGFTFQDGGTNPLMRFLPKAQPGTEVSFSEKLNQRLGQAMNNVGNDVVRNANVFNELSEEKANELNREMEIKNAQRKNFLDEQEIYNNQLELEKERFDTLAGRYAPDTQLAGENFYGNTTQGPLYYHNNVDPNNPYPPREIYTQAGGTERFPMRQNPDPTFNPETGMTEYFDPQTGQTMVYNPEPVERYLDSSIGAKSGSTSYDPIKGFQRYGGMSHPLAKFLGGGQLPQYQVGGEKGRKAKKGDVFYINNEPYKVESRYSNLAGEWVTFDKPLKGIASAGIMGGDQYNDSDIDYMGAAEFDRMIEASQSGTNTFQMGYDKGSFGYGDRFVPVEELSFWDRQGSDLGGLLATFTGDLFTPNEYNYGSGTMFWTLSDKPIEGANFDKFGINESKGTVDIDMDGEKKSIKTEYLKPGYKVTKDNVEYVVSGEEGESALSFDENRGWTGDSGEGRQIRLKQVSDPNWPGIFNANYDIGEGASFRAVDLDEYLSEWVNEGQGDASYVKGKNENESVVIGAKDYFRVDGTTDSFYYYDGKTRVNVSDPTTIDKIKKAFAEKEKENVKSTPASGRTNQGNNQTKPAPKKNPQSAVWEEF